MKVVCDEGVSRALGRRLRALGVDVSPPAKAWLGLANGRLIAAATASGFDTLLSNDKNLGFQLNLAVLQIAIVSLPTPRSLSLIRRSDDIADTLGRALPGQHVAIALDGRRTIRRAGTGGVIIVEEMPRILPFDP